MVQHTQTARFRLATARRLRRHFSARVYNTAKNRSDVALGLRVAQFVEREPSKPRCLTFEVSTPGDSLHELATTARLPSTRCSVLALRQSGAGFGGAATVTMASL